MKKSTLYKKADAVPWFDAFAEAWAAPLLMDFTFELEPIAFELEPIAFEFAPKVPDRKAAPSRLR